MHTKFTRVYLPSDTFQFILAFVFFEQPERLNALIIIIAFHLKHRSVLQSENSRRFALATLLQDFTLKLVNSY